MGADMLAVVIPIATEQDTPELEAAWRQGCANIMGRQTMNKQIMHSCGEPLHYDPATEHFICKKCGNITEEVQAEVIEPNFMVQDEEEQT